MGSAVFKSNAQQFLNKNERLKDMVLGHMAMNVEILAKRRVPVSNTKASGNRRGGGGHLQSSIRHFRSNSGQFRVEANKEYAAYQERGMTSAGTRVVKKYSTPGTGKHYFKDAITATQQKANSFIQEARMALGL